MRAVFGVCVLIIYCSILLCLIDSGTAAEDKTMENMRVLYTILHDIALPNFNQDTDTPVTERFILLMPGQVLDYTDYCTADTLHTLHDNAPVLRSALPVDENIFRLSDRVPTANPLGGGLTGKQLSTIYRNILYTIDTGSGHDPLNRTEYQEAMEFLQTEVKDPTEPTGPTLPRFELYHRYQQGYYKTTADVKHWIDGNRTASSSMDKYEDWYHENYEMLMAYRSAAYSQWLINGMKSEVEEKMAMVDIESARTEIEEARELLQSEEQPSMDGGSVYYPVHLSPSNWCEYLIASPDNPTRQQLQAKLNTLTTQKLQLQAMMNASSPSKDDIDKMKKQQNNEDTMKQNITDAAQAIKCYEYLCRAQRTNTTIEKNDTCKTKYQDPDPCDSVNKKREQMEDLSANLVQSQTESDSTTNELQAYGPTNIFLKETIDEINLKISNLKDQLNTTSIEAPLINEVKGKGKLTPQEMSQNWMSFSFSSKKSSKTVSTDSKTYKAAASFSASNPGEWSVSGGASYSRSEQDFKQKMSSTDVEVSAKLLRVTIDRNWFRPSVFGISSFFHMQKGIKAVSPGPKTDEAEFVKVVDKYQLPEYTTGFLLAKEVSMTFQGLDSSSESHALKESASATLSGSYGCFNAAASFGYGHTSSNLRVSTQSDGLHIEIPGAQIVGYYTSVLPQFPSYQSLE